MNYEMFKYCACIKCFKEACDVEMDVAKDMIERCQSIDELQQKLIQKCGQICAYCEYERQKEWDSL